MTEAEIREFEKTSGLQEKSGFKLADMQVKIIQESLTYGKVLNTCEVGAGKTTMSSVVSLLNGSTLTLVVVPPILIHGWVKWLRQISDRVIAYTGSPASREALVLTDARWVVCSHAILRSDFHKFVSLTTKRRKFDVILDEAHHGKNPKSVLFKKIQTITAGDVPLQMLTGTPISRPPDAYSYIKLKTPSLYRSMTHFEAIHVGSRDFFGNPKEYTELELLRKNLEMQTVTATKEEMHGYALKPLFPDSSYDLNPKHYSLYRRMVDEQLLSYDDGTVIDASTVQRLRQALQQIILNWSYFGNDDSLKSTGFDVLDQTIDEIGVENKANSKLLVWTKYKRSSKAVIDYCNSLGIKTAGAYSDVDTNAGVKAFMEDAETRILVANPQSCGAGLNPQHVCSEMLFLELDTVPIYARQACGRVDRMGQTKTPRIKIAVANNTVQVGMYNSLMKQDDLVTEIEPSKKGLRAMLLGQ